MKRATHDRQLDRHNFAEALEIFGKTQKEIAEDAGFPRPNVISMLRSGEMRLPIARAPAPASALGIGIGIGEKYLIATGMAEYMPETWTVVARASPLLLELQIGIKGPAPVIEQFKTLCASERRTCSESRGSAADHKGEQLSTQAQSPASHTDQHAPLDKHLGDELAQKVTLQRFRRMPSCNIWRSKAGQRLTFFSRMFSSVGSPPYLFFCSN